MVVVLTGRAIAFMGLVSPGLTIPMCAMASVMDARWARVGLKWLPDPDAHLGQDLVLLGG